MSKRIKILDMKYTKKTPYNDLKGYLPTGYHVLNKKQEKRYKKAIEKKNQNYDSTFIKTCKKPIKSLVPVQIHRNERILNLCEVKKYYNTMKSLNWNYKK